MEYKTFLAQIYQRHSTNVKLGLERMINILGRMDNPHLKLRGIHIAGTNGKGSTAAICESLLLSHNHRTGLNTSPHLVDYTERFRVNGETISASELMALYDRYAHLFEDTEASFFEITTALAFQYFVEQNVQSAVIEVGLGGRLDGTNPFASTVSAITSISIDHPKTLGNTIEKIANEKAGIIKPNTPLVLGDLPQKALEVITQQANNHNAPTYIYGRDFNVSNISLSGEGTGFDYEFPKYDIKLKNLKINLLGRHQAHNAAVALTAFYLYLETSPVETRLALSPKENNIRKALMQVNWFGRMQILSQNPLVIIDGAHNEEGISALVKNITQIFPDYKYHFLVAILRDKKLDNMIREICTIAEDIYISKNPSDRAADIEEQVAVAAECGTKYYVEGDINQSVQKCLARMNATPPLPPLTEGSKDEMLIITGSLYTIAEVIKSGI